MSDGDLEPWDEGKDLADDGASACKPAPQGKALIKEVCRLIRAARAHWDAHHNAATRMIRRRALRLYETLTAEQRKEVPQVLRVWLRYRSEKYYGARKKKGRKPS